jgi:hypothetical protein
VTRPERDATGEPLEDVRAFAITPIEALVALLDGA